MSYLKMLLGLTAVMAMALMSTGVNMASADELCTKNETPCAAGNVVTKLEQSLTGSLAAENTEGTVMETCTGSTISVSIEEQGTNKAASGKVTGLSWSNCAHGATTVKLGRVEIRNIAGTTNGTVVGKESEVTISFLGISCVYGPGSGIDLGTLKGGSPSTFALNAVFGKVAGGFLCPPDARWTAEYKLTNHAELYVHHS